MPSMSMMESLGQTVQDAVVQQHWLGPVLISLQTYTDQAVFVSLSVKAVHLEAVSDLTTDAFLACLH